MLRPVYQGNRGNGSGRHRPQRARQLRKVTAPTGAGDCDGRSSASLAMMRGCSPGRATSAPTSCGLLFISYSHVDVAWAQRFRVLLKPVVRRKRLRLWDDSQIRVGDEWHPAIEEAIERSRVALVLVSADFLASDYVMEHELPALVRHGVRLAPVLVGDCYWSVVDELAAVQWLHDPVTTGRSGCTPAISPSPTGASSEPATGSSPWHRSPRSSQPTRRRASRFPL